MSRVLAWSIRDHIVANRVIGRRLPGHNDPSHTAQETR
jgi:hypothetical protein